MESKDCNNERYLTQQEERALIASAQAGDQEARDRLVLAALPFARKNLARFCRDLDEDDAEDLMQEAVPVLYDCVERYDLSHPARARLYVFAARYLEKAAASIMKHRVLLRYRDDVPDAVDEDVLEANLCRQQIRRIVRAILATLSVRDQDILISRHGNDTRTTRAAMAQRYNCPEHVIEYAEKRAREQFARALAAADSGSFLNSLD